MSNTYQTGEGIIDVEKRKRQAEYTLGDPTVFPSEFLVWLKRYIEQSGITLPASSIIGITPSSLRPASYGTSLPATPVDGQEAILVDSTALPNYSWRFRYNAFSSSPYRWEFIGGAPVVKGISGFQALVGVGFWTDLPTVGPSFNVPRAGVYNCGISCRVGTTAYQCYAGVAHGATDPGRHMSMCPVGATFVSYAQPDDVGEFTAGQEVRMRYYQTAAITPGYDQRFLSVLPMRVA